MILAIFYYITKINQFSQVDFLSKNKEGVIKTPFFIIDFSQLSTQSVRNIKPPAMRVRKRKFATKYTFRYNRVVQATINERKVFIWLYYSYK